MSSRSVFAPILYKAICPRPGSDRSSQDCQKTKNYRIRAGIDLSHLTDHRRQLVVYSRISRSHGVFEHSGWTLFVSGQRPYVNLPDLPCSRAASRRAAFACYSVFQVLRPVSLCAVATRLGFSALVCGMPRRMPIPQSSTGTSAGFSNGCQ